MTGMRIPGMRRAGGEIYWKLPPDVNGNARFSHNGDLRYWLTRACPGSGGLNPLCAFVGLNPSTADERDERGDDPTVRTCYRRAREWGFGGMVMLNLFAYRETSPARMRLAEGKGIDLIGENDRYLEKWARKANASPGKHRFGEGGIVIAAWGALLDGHRGRACQVTSIFRKLGPIYRLEDIGPKHPRSVTRHATPCSWVPACLDEDESDVTPT
jgi:hypothetical protein